MTQFLIDPWAQRRVEESILRVVQAAKRPLGAFFLELEWNDLRVEKIYEVLKAAGARERTSHSGPEVHNSPLGYYEVRTLHRFTTEELALAQYLHLHGLTDERTIYLRRTGPTDLTGVDTEGASRKPGLLEWYSTLIVREAFKPTIDAENFRGMAMRPTYRYCERSAKPPASGLVIKVLPTPPGKAFFEIVPSLELPPMVASEIERRRPLGMGGPVTPGGPGAIVNPGFDDGRAVYTRADLASIGPFDIARTFEYLLPRGTEARWNIISQRFYRFMLKHKVAVDAMPIKIIED